jgi:hypothetical protein
MTNVNSNGAEARLMPIEAMPEATLALILI